MPTDTLPVGKYHDLCDQVSDEADDFVSSLEGTTDASRQAASVMAQFLDAVKAGNVDTSLTVEMREPDDEGTIAIRIGNIRTNDKGEVLATAYATRRDGTETWREPADTDGPEAADDWTLGAHLSNIHDMVANGDVARINGQALPDRDLDPDDYDDGSDDDLFPFLTGPDDDF